MLEKIKVQIGNEEYLELEGVKINNKLISENFETRRDHIANGLHSEYKIKVVRSRETWEVNNKTITVDVTQEFYNKSKPTITRISDDIMNMLVYDEKSVAEVKELLTAK